MAEKSWSRNNGGYAKHERAIRDGKSGRSNHGDGIMEDESPRRGTGSTQEVPMMHPVGTQEAPRMHPGSTQEAHMGFHDTQEALEASESNYCNTPKQTCKSSIRIVILPCAFECMIANYYE